ncbi:PROTEIN DMP3 [Salix purpurea]|uniref:PROTEIN DMP3 n=1 Tax=Salix purpurea TaxID=77065 RepID=A0A9Q1A398_SALPP|nr:PROTEIN DMP3 [Salix purpurea]
MKGLWPSSGSAGSSVDLSSYKLRVGDFAHAFFSLIVFSVLSLLDSNTVECFYPSFESTEKVLLMVLPPVIGAVSGTVFVLFPNRRHGIGYPSSDSSQNS